MLQVHKRTADTTHRCLALGLLAFLTVLVPSGPSWAQAQEPRESQESSHSALVNPRIPAIELAHRLVPLTRDELVPLARVWQDIVREKTEAIARRQVDRLRAPSDETAESTVALARMVEERGALFTRYGMVVDALEKKGGDEALVTELRAYRDSILFSETSLASRRALVSAFATWLTRGDGGRAMAQRVAVFLLSFVALLLIASFARALLRRWLQRASRLSKLLQALLLAVVYWGLLAVGLLLGLTALGVNVGPVFAMIGGVSFILAFALQDTLGNLASGLMIIINRPFDEGDYVVVDGIGGTVQSVNVVATTVTTPDNQVIVIPNKNVWGNIITNVTASDTRRIDLIFGISYEDSIADAQRVIENTVGSHPLVLSDPEPVVRTHELAASSVNFVCRPWVKTDDYWTVYWDLTHQMKEAFDAESITIPYPQQEVRIRSHRSESIGADRTRAINASVADR